MDRPIGWAVLVPQLSKLTRVCVYDRAGLGRSDPAPVPRTSLDVAKKAGHNIQLEDPRLVIDAISDVVARARTRSQESLDR